MVYDVTRLASRQAADSTGSGAAAGSSGSGSNTGTIAMSTFLQLIVAQIKNQDPLNPADGAQFVAQLAAGSSSCSRAYIRGRTYLMGLCSDCRCADIVSSLAVAS